MNRYQFVRFIGKSQEKQRVYFRGKNNNGMETAPDENRLPGAELFYNQGWKDYGKTWKNVRKVIKKYA